MFRIGQGYDIHRLVAGRELILGGVHLDYSSGLLGHSDADALLHAIIDALFGAAALGDIGRHFPDTAQDFFAVDSRHLLRVANKKIHNDGWQVINVDATIIAQAPKLATYIPEMCSNIAHDLQIDVSCVNVKGKTNEELGYLGRSEGIETQAIVLLQKINS